MSLLKRLLCLLLVLLTICTLCACNDNDDQSRKQRSKSISDDDEEEEETEDPVELAKEDLEYAYEHCCEGAKGIYAKLGYDKMALTIDTNPYDNKNSNSYQSDAISAIQAINRYLDLPSSLLEKMSSTRALDGTQTQNCGVYSVTWSYHPDSGLKVIYEVNP